MGLGGPGRNQGRKAGEGEQKSTLGEDSSGGFLGSKVTAFSGPPPPLFFPSFRGRRWEEGGRGRERGTPVSPTPPLSSLFLSLPGGGEGEGCGGGTKPEGGLVKTEKAIKHSAGSVRPTPEHP